MESSWNSHIADGKSWQFLKKVNTYLLYNQQLYVSAQEKQKYMW